MSRSVSEVLDQLDLELRDRYDKLGCVQGENGSYLTGHVPHVAPLAYLCVRYPSLDDDAIGKVEAEAGRHIAEPYRQLLGHMNGASLLGVSLHGGVFGSVDRSGVGIGQPISIRYQNAVERPDYIPQGHLGIGAINGERRSQGHLYLTSTGQVEMYNAHFDLIGARWVSLSEFLSEEFSRRISLFDDEGKEVQKAKRLPGDTCDWERLAEAAIGAQGRVGRLERLFGRLRPK